MSDAAAERSAHVHRGHGDQPTGEDPFVGPEFGPVRLKAVAVLEAEIERLRAEIAALQAKVQPE